jgi:hypothetical protein
MKSKLPFKFNYTQEMSDKFNKELKESGKCAVSNPAFFGNWNLYKAGTPEYELAFSKKQNRK